jgi:hypothetical protein
MERLKFENVYRDYVHDICMHCNLHQTKPIYLRYIDLGDAYAYSYKCQHCEKMYVVEIQKEKLLKLGRDIHHGYNHFVIPGYEERIFTNTKYAL